MSSGARDVTAVACRGDHPVPTMALRPCRVSLAVMAWALATIAALLVGYAAVSRRLGPLNVSEAMFFMTAGLLVGMLGLVDGEVHGEQVKLLAEMTLTMVLFADRLTDLRAGATAGVRGARATPRY